LCIETTEWTCFLLYGIFIYGIKYQWTKIFKLFKIKNLTENGWNCEKLKNVINIKIEVKRE